MLLGDFLQLALVRGKPVCAYVDEHDKIDRLLSLNLWHSLQFAELTEVMIQKSDVNLLNKTRIGDIDADVQQKLKARYVNETADNYLQNAVHMFAENYPTVHIIKSYLTHCQVNCTE